ncbi:MAG: hypothetical protein K0R89_443 [Ramlibacter sp.]|jgi:hypothetical protein|nr:hypothetical protein [Ramlibacter sp.]
MTRNTSRPAPRGEDDPSASQANLPNRTEDPLDPSHGKKPHDATAPRAGRTGGLGSRAERPSEGGRKQPVETTHQHEGGRRGKAPSACDEQAKQRPRPARNQ